MDKQAKVRTTYSANREDVEKVGNKFRYILQYLHGAALLNSTWMELIRVFISKLVMADRIYDRNYKVNGIDFDESRAERIIDVGRYDLQDIERATSALNVYAQYCQKSVDTGTYTLVIELTEAMEELMENSLARCQIFLKTK